MQESDRSRTTAVRKLSERAWSALAEGLRTFQWFKDEFETLVRAHFSKAPEVLVSVNFDMTKRQAVGQLIARLRSREPAYQDLVVDALMALSDVDPSFPHLARLEDGPGKVRDAQAALAAIKEVTEHYSELSQARQTILRETERLREQESARRLHEEALSALRDRFFEMHGSSADPQRRGREFEGLVNDLFGLWDLEPRASYSIEHEQIDGAFTFRTDDYILEARWWTPAVGTKEVNDFRTKVDAKARNTLGLCISVSGFTQDAIERHSQPQTPLILMDGSDLVPILEGRIGLDEVLRRKRRHAAETGKVMYRAQP